MRKIISLLKIFKSSLYGKKKLQPLFEKLFYISLKGMNYGNGSDFETSGEEYIFNILNKQYAGENMIIFDVGANKGNYIKSLLKNIKTDKHIYAFEPTTFCIEEIKKIKDPHVTLSEFGLSHEKSETKIFFDYDGSTWASIENNNYERHNKNLDKFETIKLDTLDNFCGNHEIEKIHFMKIDIEGHEIHALKGARNYLENNRIDFIQFEFGLASLHSRNNLNDFFKAMPNYQIYRVLLDGIQKINYHEAFEIFLTTNYLAINKNIKLKD